jgi:Domain of unknown function (DUF4388)
VALQGTLDTFALADVLRLLSATTKSGRLQIDGDRGVGNIWLVEGEVVAGTVDLRHPAGTDGVVPCTDPSEVLFELLRHVEGTFEFIADEHTDDGRPPVAVEEVVDAAEQKLLDWRAVEAVVPSLDHEVTLADHIDEEVVIGREGWKTMLAIGEGRTIGQVGERLEMGEIAVSNAVKALVDERLAVIGEVVTVEAAPEVEQVTDAEVPATPTIEDVVADLGASPELDVVVRAELAPGEVAVDPASLGGSRDVDLDTALDSDETGHAYLADDTDGSAGLPEPLPSELSEQPEPEELPADPESLAQMSPRAAEAITAAEGGAPVDHAEQAEGDEQVEGEDGEQPMNRNLLMKFISSK